MWEMYCKTFDPDQAFEQHRAWIAQFKDLKNATAHCMKNLLHHLPLHVHVQLSFDIPEPLQEDPALQ